MSNLSNDSRKKAEDIIRGLAGRWPHDYVTRKQFRDFGGQLSPGSLANLDSQGIGIKGMFHLGRETCYPVESCIEFLIERIK